MVGPSRLRDEIEPFQRRFSWIIFLFVGTRGAERPQCQRSSTYEKMIRSFYNHVQLAPPSGALFTYLSIFPFYEGVPYIVIFTTRGIQPRRRITNKKGKHFLISHVIILYFQEMLISLLNLF